MKIKEDQAHWMRFPKLLTFSEPSVFAKKKMHQWPENHENLTCPPYICCVQALDICNIHVVGMLQVLGRHMIGVR